MQKHVVVRNVFNRVKFQLPWLPYLETSFDCKSPLKNFIHGCWDVAWVETFSWTPISDNVTWHDILSAQSLVCYGRFSIPLSVRFLVPVEMGLEITCMLPEDTEVWPAIAKTIGVLSIECTFTDPSALKNIHMPEALRSSVFSVNFTDHYSCNKMLWFWWQSHCIVCSGMKSRTRNDENSTGRK